MNDQTPQNSQLPGQQLKQAREEKQLSLDQVANALHLSTDIISQLESNQFEKIAVPTYTRGYLRSYCKYLQLDAEKIIEQYNQNLIFEETPEIIPEVSQKPQVSSSDKPVKITTYLIVFALIILLLVWWQSQYRSSQTENNELVSEPAEQAEVQGVAPAFDYEFTRIEHPDGPFINNDSANSIPYEEQPVLSEPDQQSNYDDTIGDNIVINTGGDGSTGDLLLTIREESWVEVYNAQDKRLFHRLAQPGSQIKIKGLIPLSVLLGNANGVDVQFNGEPVDSVPFTRANVARLRLGE